ncbi:MAG: hypothetical protein ACYC67_24965 [Prosthecobacter sp.]
MSTTQTSESTASNVRQKDAATCPFLAQKLPQDTKKYHFLLLDAQACISGGKKMP